MIATTRPTQGQDFVVVHPMFDVEEQKCDGAHLGYMNMSLPVRMGLIMLRVYVMGVCLLLAFHELAVAGIIKHI